MNLVCNLTIVRGYGLDDMHARPKHSFARSTVPLDTVEAGAAAAALD